MSLPETRAQLVDSLKANLSVLLNPVAITDVGGELEECAAWFQALGICNLLLKADSGLFFEDLIRSGHTRRYFLRKSREEGNTTDYQLAISRWDSFLDAVAAGEFQLAREIVALSSSIWVATGEYEDDFLYRYFLHQFISPPHPQRDALLQAALTRWQAWLSGQPSARFDCCSALLARSAGAFDAAFADLVASRQAEVSKQQKMSLAADITFEPRAHIFVEGLALLRIAHTIGLTVRADFPLCPSLARVAPARAVVQDIFPEIERERAQNP